MTQPQRLKHLLLLALRVLAVMTLAVVLARPVWVRPGLLAMGAEGAKVLILDNSASMGYQEDRGERYNLAKKAAREILENLKGQVLIIPTAPVAGKPVQDTDVHWMGVQEALRELAAIPLSFGRGDPLERFGLAYRKMKGLDTSREILVISDLARGDWEGFNAGRLGSASADAAVTFIRIGGASRDPNLAIKDVRMSEKEAIAGVPFRVEVTVSNLSPNPGNTLLQLFLSGSKRDQKQMNLKPGEEGMATFEFIRDQPGWVDGQAMLSADRLPADDVFYFPLKVREKVKVLIVDGDPRSSLRSSESYYLRNALQPGGLEGSPFQTRVVAASELTGLDLRPYEAVFFLNVANPLAMSSCLGMGKSVFVFLGDQVIPEEYNRLALFPWRIGAVNGSGQARIARFDEKEEALKFFSGPGGESLKSVLVHHYFKIEGVGRNLLTLANGDPLLSKSDSGKGRLYLFASSADMDWNDLPLKGAYLPLVQGLLKEAVGLANGSSPPSVRYGEPLGEKDNPVQITGPRGGPGVYQFPSSGNVRRGINIPPEESDLGKVSGEEMKQKFGTLNIQLVDYKEGALHADKTGRKELWPIFLSALLVILAVEMVVAAWI